MRVKYVIKGVLDLRVADAKALEEAADPLQVIQTAKLQGGSITCTIEPYKRPKKAAQADSSQDDKGDEGSSDEGEGTTPLNEQESEE